jgi:hypothetical protein
MALLFCAESLHISKHNEIQPVVHHTIYSVFSKCLHVSWVMLICHRVSYIFWFYKSDITKSFVFSFLLLEMAVSHLLYCLYIKCLYYQIELHAETSTANIMAQLKCTSSFSSVFELHMQFCVVVCGCSLQCLLLLVHRIYQNMRVNIVEYMIQVVLSCATSVRSGFAMAGETHQALTSSTILSEPNTR